MAYRDSTTASGTINQPAVAVPSGVQAGDIIILAIGIDNLSVSFTGLWPSGFTQLYDSNITLDGHSAGIAWKRATGADSGNYTLSGTGAGQEWVMQAAAFSGRHATNNPVATANIQNTGQSSPVSVTATQVTAVNGDDLLWVSVPDVSGAGYGNGHTPPTNFVEAEDAENAWSNLSMAYRNDVPEGATGNITGTFALSSGTSGWAAYLVRIPAAEGGGAQSLPAHILSGNSFNHAMVR